MTTFPMTMNWSDQGTSPSRDAVFFMMALALHAPLLFVELDMKKKTIDRPTSRLVAVDLIEPDAPKPVEPPKPVVKKKTGFLSKLKQLVKKSPPPPPPKPKKLLEPKKLDLAPKNIKLEPKLNQPKLASPRLKTKAGFKTKADPKLVQKKKISLKNMSAGIAPLSAKKLGTVQNRTKLKSGKSGFQISKSDSLSGIGGGKNINVNDPSAPTLAINTGRKGSVEKFTAPPPQLASKKGFKGGSVKGLNDKKLSLRDRIIARDAAPTAIGGSPTEGRSGGVPGGVPGGLATKKNAGSFQADNVQSIGKPALGVGSVGSTKKVAAIQSPIKKKKKKKEMFTITGPLKNRPIIRKQAPEYPEWAIARGIEASVVLQFTVTPSGRVKDSIRVQRTSGYPRLDETAKKALLKWLFSPLADDANREEVGFITFNYSLS